MKLTPRKSLIAGMIVALAGAPAWADTAAPQRDSRAPMEQLKDHPAATPQADQTSGQRASGEILNMTPNDLQGKAVVASSGEELGTIKSVVSDRTENRPYALISSSSGNDLLVPLDQLQLSGTRLQASASMDELRSGPSYEENRFVQVKPQDEPISEFSAFESTGHDSQATPQQEQQDNGPMLRGNGSTRPDAGAPDAAQPSTSPSEPGGPIPHGQETPSSTD